MHSQQLLLQHSPHEVATALLQGASYNTSNSTVHMHSTLHKQSLSCTLFKEGSGRMSESPGMGWGERMGKEGPTACTTTPLLASQPDVQFFNLKQQEHPVLPDKIQSQASKNERTPVLHSHPVPRAWTTTNAFPAAASA
jgi:hypothetical protein